MATVSLASLRSSVQMFLKDTGAKKWTVEDLDRFINLAVTQWTTDRPIKSSTEYTVVSGQHEYDLPGNAVAVVTLQGYFTSTSTEDFLAPMAPLTAMWTEREEARKFLVDFPEEGKFYLPLLPSGSTFMLHYGAVHDGLADDGDVLNLRTRRWGEQAVIAYACYLAFLPYSSSRARLEQWATKQDLNVKNPLTDQAQMWLEEYDRLLERHSTPDMFHFVSLER